MGKSRFIWQNFTSMLWLGILQLTTLPLQILQSCIIASGESPAYQGRLSNKISSERKKNLSQTPKKSTFHVRIYSPLQCMACTLAERYVIGVFQGFPLVGFNQIANLKIFTAWTTFFSSALLYSVESPSNGTVVGLGWETVHGWSGDRSSHHRCAHTVADH